MGDIFKPQDPVELFFWGFEQGYWNHMEQNINTLMTWMGG